ncbi:MAG: ABC transporter permease [Candidatus Heimdallarchaeota archaeon]
MIKYLVKRLLALIPTVFVVLTILFFAMRLAPGDPVAVICGVECEAETIQAIRTRLGLDRPLYAQYLDFIVKAFRLDFGESWIYRRTTMEKVLKMFPHTLALAGASILVSVAIGIPAGVISAKKRNMFTDHLTMTLSMLGVSMPVFYFGILLMLLFGVYLRWLPATQAGKFSNPVDYLKHLILPAFALGFSNAAMTARITRSCMLDVLRQDYIRTAHAKGAWERRIIYRHAMRNAMIPVITIVGMNFGFLLGGTVLAEFVFARPGLGRVLIDATFGRDYPQLQASVFFFSVVYLLINVAVDVLYTYLDPRIKYE